MADDEIEGSRRPDDADDAPDEDSVETSDSEASGPGDEAGRPSVEVGEPTEAVPVVESSADLLARRFVDDDGDPDEDDGHIAAEPVFRRDRARIPRVLRRDAAPKAVSAPREPRAPRGSYRVRRVRRLVRHIEPWSVLKVSLVFYLCIWGLLVIATRMLWSAADEAGTISKIESFIK
ncbi:MAG: DUF3566 domain-containing protein, partial [Acidimicrobiales bacterium]